MLTKIKKLQDIKRWILREVEGVPAEKVSPLNADSVLRLTRTVAAPYRILAPIRTVLTYSPLVVIDFSDFQAFCLCQCDLLRGRIRNRGSASQTRGGTVRTRFTYDHYARSLITGKQVDAVLPR